ncbi:transcriptional regulator [Thermocladium modestius]|uniref:Transcriptional regulator n=1 Tax=Thermocladium modestius TaxID=62609 RepID=A0A830GWC8_9CREN|nr:TIGR00266 family protein [Thermocladium modestius]GGP21304.1 transcriptional regulator [Thermocladium modestius]
MQYSILGDDLQLVKVIMDEGESIYGEGGHLLYKSPTVNLQARDVGGFMAGLKRAVTGATFFVLQLTGPGETAFAGSTPGKVVQISLGNGDQLLAEHGSFLFAEGGVRYDASLAKLTAGIFGGEGLFLAKFTGPGNVFLHGTGNVLPLQLGDGEEVDVEAGHLLAFDAGMQYGIKRAGGLKTMLLGGEGLFFVNIRGPGRVWLRSVSLAALASALSRDMPCPPSCRREAEAGQREFRV